MPNVSSAVPTNVRQKIETLRSRNRGDRSLQDFRKRFVRY
jgi:hypothetical protein